jgi:hypothetical protein
MELTDYFVLLTRLGVGAVTTFLAILLWSQTRDVSWVLAIVATLVGYAQIILETLEGFGIISGEFFVVSGFPLLRVILVNLPMVFLSLAFITMVARKHPK